MQFPQSSSIEYTANQAKIIDEHLQGNEQFQPLHPILDKVLRVSFSPWNLSCNEITSYSTLSLQNP